MKENIILNAKGEFDIKASILSFLNKDKPYITDFGLIEHESEKVFGLIFSDYALALEFLEQYSAFVEKPQITAKNLAMPLNSEDLIYFFYQVLQAGSLLEDPNVPPVARVDLLELYTTKILEELLVPSSDLETIKVGANFISFKDGKLNVTMRGRIPDKFLGLNNNFVVSFNDFQKLAIVCFNTREKSSHIKPLESILCAIEKVNVLNKISKISKDVKVFAQQSLRVSKIIIDPFDKRKIFLDVKDLAEPGETGVPIDRLKAYTKLLEELLGIKFKISIDLFLGSSKVQVCSVAETFSKEDIDELVFLFEETKDFVFMPDFKQSIINVLKELVVEQIRKEETLFKGAAVLQEAITCPIMLATIEEPVVLGKDGESFSMVGIGPSLAENRHPLTREPVSFFRENKLLLELLNYGISTPNWQTRPGCLDGIEDAVILPDGTTYDRLKIKEIFLKQNAIPEEDLKDSTVITFKGDVLSWADVWPNKNVQVFVDFYNNVPKLNPKREVVPYSDNPLLSLAATSACLIDSEFSLNIKSAQAQLLKEELPVHISWNSEAGFRLSFINPDYGRKLFSILIKEQLIVETIDVKAPYELGLRLKDKASIIKFIFDICGYNDDYTGFDRYLLAPEDSCFSVSSAKRRKKTTMAEAAAPSADDGSMLESLLINFFSAIFYSCDDELFLLHKRLVSKLQQEGSLRNFSKKHRNIRNIFASEFLPTPQLLSDFLEPVLSASPDLMFENPFGLPFSAGSLPLRSAITPRLLPSMGGLSSGGIAPFVPPMPWLPGASRYLPRFPLNLPQSAFSSPPASASASASAFASSSVDRTSMPLSRPNLSLAGTPARTELGPTPLTPMFMEQQSGITPANHNLLALVNTPVVANSTDITGTTDIRDSASLEPATYR